MQILKQMADRLSDMAVEVPSSPSASDEALSDPLDQLDQLGSREMLDAARDALSACAPICLLCGKRPSVTELDAARARGVPYLCSSCGQRFELIQPGEPRAQPVEEGEVEEDKDDEDTDRDVKPTLTDDQVMIEGGPLLTPSAHSSEDGLGMNVGPLECGECGVKFENAVSLERHAMMHMSDKPFKCDVCYKGFYRKDKLKLHLMIHRGDKPLKCDVCGKRFLRKDHLKNHVKTHSKPPPPPKRQQHSQRAAAGGGAAGGLLDALGDGFAPEKRDERPFSCDVCHKAFSRKDNLAAHMRIHTGEKPFACELCAKRFAEKCALKRHMVVHTQEKLYSCGVCGRAFARKGHLTEHVWLHDEVKPFLCNVCGKAFARDRKLKSHMMTHSGERPFKCDVCDRAFARKDNLKSHLSLHYGIKPIRSARGSSKSTSPDVPSELPPQLSLPQQHPLVHQPPLLHSQLHQIPHQHQPSSTVVTLPPSLML